MSFREAVKQAAKQAYCQAAGTAAELNDAINRLNPLPKFNPARAAQGLFCDNPSPPPTPQPNFTGGQCPNAFYNITGTHNATGASNNQPLTGTFNTSGVGPISSISGETDTTGSSPSSFIVVVDRNGRRRVDSFSNARFSSVTGISVTPATGQPNNCGDPPPPVLPFPTGGIPVSPGPVSYVNNEGDTVVTVPTAIILPPIVNIKGEINIPIDVTIEGITFEANLNVNTGDININIGGDNGNRPRGDESGERDNTETDGEPPTSGTDGEDLEEERPEDGERRIIAVIVTSTSVQLRNRLTRLSQNDNPDIFAPSLGHVNFLCRIGSGVTGAWSEDIKVKNRRQLIPCPWKYGAVDVKGTPQPGVQFTLTPVYDRIQSQVEDGVST